MAKALAAVDLRGSTEEELDHRLAEAKIELFNLRFQAATGQLESHGRLRAVRKEIARIYTVKRERELGIVTLEEDELAEDTVLAEDTALADDTGLAEETAPAEDTAPAKKSRRSGRKAASEPAPDTEPAEGTAADSEPESSADSVVEEEEDADE
jgi:large subunit ribosomal protein L29